MRITDQGLISVRKWVVSEATTAKRHGYSTIHLDQLLMIDSAWLLNNFAEAERICVEALRALARIEGAGHFVLSIRFDLGYRELVAKEFELEQLHGPASLYIVALAVFNLPSNEEVHRFPVEVCTSSLEGYRTAKYIEHTRSVEGGDTEPYSAGVFLDVFPDLKTILDNTN